MPEKPIKKKWKSVSGRKKPSGRTEKGTFRDVSFGNTPLERIDEIDYECMQLGIPRSEWRKMKLEERLNRQGRSMISEYYRPELVPSHGGRRKNSRTPS